jgi:hypothetical protein
VRYSRLQRLSTGCSACRMSGSQICTARPKRRS